MPIGAITLSDPLNQIPPLVLRTIADGYSRGYIQSIAPGDATSAGNLTLKGRYTQAFYSWDISARISEYDVLHFQALCAIQQQRYQELSDGHLLLQDEIGYLIPELPQRPIVPGSERSVVGFPTGFGIHQVLIQLDPQFQAYLGVRNRDNVPFQIVTFKSTEVR